METEQPQPAPQSQPPQRIKPPYLIENELSLLLNCQPTPDSIKSSIKTLLEKDVEAKLKVVDWEKLLQKKNEKLSFLEEETARIDTLKQNITSINLSNLEIQSKNTAIIAENEKLQSQISAIKDESSTLKQTLQKLHKQQEEDLLQKESNTLRREQLRDEILSLTNKLGLLEKVTLPLLQERLRSSEQAHLCTKEALQKSTEKLQKLSTDYSKLCSELLSQRESFLSELMKEQSLTEPLKKEVERLKQENVLQSSRERQTNLKAEEDRRTLSSVRRSSEERELLLREEIATLSGSERQLQVSNQILEDRLAESQNLLKIFRNRKQIEEGFCSANNSKRKIVGGSKGTNDDDDEEDGNECGNDDDDEEERDQNSKLKRCLRDVVAQLEAKIPEIRLLEQEKRSLLCLLEEKEEKEHSLLEVQTDLQRQLCHILDDQQQKEQHQQQCNATMTSEMVITKELLPYKSVEELQEKNVKLLRAIRALSREGNDWKVVEERLSALQARRHQQDKLVVSLKRQRDYLRQILLSDSSDGCGGFDDGGCVDHQQQQQLTHQLDNNDSSATELIGALRERCHILKEERDCLLKEVEDGKARIASLAERSQKDKKDLSVVEDELMLLKKLTSQKDARITSLNDRISVLQQQQHDSGDAIATATANTLALDDRERMLLKQGISSLQEEVLSLKGAIGASEEEAKVEIRLLKEELGEVGRQRVQLERRLIDVGKEYSEFALSHRKIVSDLTSAISGFTVSGVVSGGIGGESNYDQQQQQSCDSEQTSSAQSDIVKLQNELRHCKHEIEMLKIVSNRDQLCYSQRYESFIAEINMLQESKAALTARIPLMEDELAKLALLTEENERLTVKLSEVSQSLATLEEERDALVVKLEHATELVAASAVPAVPADNEKQHEPLKEQQPYQQLMERIEGLQALKEENASLRYQLDNSPIKELEAKIESGELRYQNLLKQSRLIAKERNDLRAAASSSKEQQPQQQQPNQQELIERIKDLEIKLEKYAEAIRKYRIIKDLYTKELQASKAAKADFEEGKRKWDEERSEVAMRHQLLVGNWQSRCKRAEQALEQLHQQQEVADAAVVSGNEEEEVMEDKEEEEEVDKEKEIDDSKQEKDVKEAIVEEVDTTKVTNEPQEPLSEPEQQQEEQSDDDDNVVMEEAEAIDEEEAEEAEEADENEVYSEESDNMSGASESGDVDGIESETMPESESGVDVLDDDDDEDGQHLMADQEAPSITIIEDDSDADDDADADDDSNDDSSSSSIQSSVYTPSTTEGGL